MKLTGQQVNNENNYLLQPETLYTQLSVCVCLTLADVVLTLPPGRVAVIPQLAQQRGRVVKQRDENDKIKRVTR